MQYHYITIIIIINSSTSNTIVNIKWNINLKTVQTTSLFVSFGSPLLPPQSEYIKCSLL